MRLQEDLDGGPAVLDGALAERIRADVAADAGACAAAVLSAEEAEFDLARGAAGIAVLLGEVHRAGLGDGLPAPVAALQVARERLRGARAGVGLWHGAAGVGWAQLELTGRPAPALSAPLLRWTERAAPGAWDLITGVVGIGVFAVEAGEEALLAAVLAKLERVAEVQPEGGLAWPSSGRRGEYDLGVAHGQAGVIGFLASVGDRRAARALLEPAVAWLARQARPRPSPWAWPHITGSGTAPGSRLAWCYGDPGVALALMRAAVALADERLGRVAADVALRAAERPRAGSGVRDAGLCHGAAGLAHIFGRLWQLSGELACREAAIRWSEAALELRLRPGYALPYPSGWVQAGGAVEFAEDPALLTGGAGASLALLAATQPATPSWSRIVLSA